MSRRYALSPGAGLPASLRQFRDSTTMYLGHDKRLFKPDASYRASSTKPRVVVAIPVQNEVLHIGPCLHALAQQRGDRADRVVLLLNGCTDGTADFIREIAPNLDLNIMVAERTLLGARANAGFARRLALQHAACGLAGQDVLMTTDADGRVAPDWIESNLASLRHGADAVCGRAEIDPIDALRIPPHLHEDDARESRLASLLDEMAAVVDPDPDDPWPRHTESSGASIAVTVAAFRRVGGIPPVACGEDRAFIDKLRQVDARIRHAPSVSVSVSGRIHGRAAGGMADTIRRRIVRQDEYTDSAVEPTGDRFRRVSLRALARALWAGIRTDWKQLAHALDTTVETVRRALALPFFGCAWAALERACPVLHARRVRFSDLPAEIEAAIVLRARWHPPHACQLPASHPMRA